MFKLGSPRDKGGGDDELDMDHGLDGSRCSRGDTGDGERGGRRGSRIDDELELDSRGELSDADRPLAGDGAGAPRRRLNRYRVETSLEAILLPLFLVAT